MEEAHVDSTTATHMLRSEIRRLMTDRSELRQQRTDNDRSALNTERRTQVFQEMIDKLKTERYELQRSNYVLKRRSEESERKVFDAKIKARKNVEIKSEKKCANKGYVVGNIRVSRSAADSGSLYNSSVLHSDSIREPTHSINPQTPELGSCDNNNNNINSAQDNINSAIKELPGKILA
jgi:hypothetical protein